MRTVGIVLATLVAVVLLVAGGGYVYTRYVSPAYALSVAVNPWGHLDITARTPQPVFIRGVAFNDHGMNECTPRPGPNFVIKKYTWFDLPNNKWYFKWDGRNTVTLEEGQSAVAQFDRRLCGDKIVKAEVFTSLGSFTYYVPDPSRTAVGGSGWVPMHLGW